MPQYLWAVTPQAAFAALTSKLEGVAVNPRQGPHGNTNQPDSAEQQWQEHRHPVLPPLLLLVQARATTCRRDLLHSAAAWMHRCYETVHCAWLQLQSPLCPCQHGVLCHACCMEWVQKAEGLSRLQGTRGCVHGYQAAAVNAVTVTAPSAAALVKTAGCRIDSIGLHIHLHTSRVH